jgi:hypothetical protein
VLLAVVSLSCGVTPQDVRSTRSVMVTTSTTTSAPDTTVSTAAPAPSVPAAIEEFRPSRLVDIPDDDGVEFSGDSGDEAAVHTLAMTANGWLTGGSVTQATSSGRAALWPVSSGGVFGAPILLPNLVSGSPSFVRDMLVVAGQTVAVGRTGAGASAQATVWLVDASGQVSAVALPTPVDQEVHGTSAARIVALNGGTLVVAGQAGGPYFSSVVLWTSVDQGATWLASGSTEYSFYEPRLVTDGRRVLVITTETTDLSGNNRHHVVQYVVTPEGAEVIDHNTLDLLPGQWFDPMAAIWDGAQFVIGADTDGLPILATSPDGVEWTTTSMDYPGVDVESTVQALLTVDGRLQILLGQDGNLFGYDAQSGSALDLPEVKASELGYVLAHEPIATNGHRVGFVTATWAGHSFVSYDGTAWKAKTVTELPPHRNLTRLDVRQVATAAGSEVALLAGERMSEPGLFDVNDVNVVWRPSGADTWHLLDLGEHLRRPVALTSRGDLFLIGDVDATPTLTRWWQFDPVSGRMQPLGTTPGSPRRVVGASDGFYARMEGADASDPQATSLWFSADGRVWSHIELPGEVEAVCSDGQRAAAAWATPHGDADEFGTTALADGVPTPVGEPWTTKPFAVVTEFRRTERCAVGPNEILTTHLSYDYFLGATVPSLDRTGSAPFYERGLGLLSPLLPGGSSETWIEDITWDGKEWVAIGHLSDYERSMDAVVWRSSNGSTWDEGTVLAGGPGNQIAYSVAVRDGDLVIGGLDGQAGRIWRIPIDGP